MPTSRNCRRRPSPEVRLGWAKTAGAIRRGGRPTNWDLPISDQLRLCENGNLPRNSNRLLNQGGAKKLSATLRHICGGLRTQFCHADGIALAGGTHDRRRTDRAGTKPAADLLRRFRSVSESQWTAEMRRLHHPRWRRVEPRGLADRSRSGPARNPENAAKRGAAHQGARDLAARGRSGSLNSPRLDEHASEIRSQITSRYPRLFLNLSNTIVRNAILVPARYRRLVDLQGAREARKILAAVLKEVGESAHATLVAQLTTNVNDPRCASC